ncbi:C-terminal binding protein [Cohnella abietis]|uniref:Dehydrogenase n=1 Tax=Cohnella abietis TaxID=2507935 RepID=A0A3T1D3R1_9BACL|nr:C-terminal binding protein [Cohnella abietis]BBI32752.1 dehydrogenase [Cohnella abietis]
MNFRVVIAASDPEFPDYSNEKQILESISASLEARICNTVSEVVAFCKDAHAIITNHSPFTKEVIDQLEQCKVIVRYGIGYDNVDIAAAAVRNIPVVNIPDYGIQEVADHTFTLLLSTVRKIPTMDRNVRKGDWQIDALRPIVGLHNKVLGLAGFGNISREVANRAKGFNLQLIAYDPYVPDEVFQQMGVRKVDFNTLLSESDFISSHLPLNKATEHIFNREAFERMKRTAFLVNTSRGGVVHTSDLVWALENRVIAGVGLDVYEEEPLPVDHPLLALEQCVLSGHAAWYSEDSIVRLQQYAALEVKRVLSGERPKHVVNGV